MVSEEGRRYSSISDIVPARSRRDVRFQLSSPGPRRDSDAVSGDTPHGNKEKGEAQQRNLLCLDEQSSVSASDTKINLI